MTVTSIGEVWPGREYRAAAPDDTSAVRQWLAKTDNKWDTAVTVINYGIANGYFPERFSPHPDNAYLTARELRAQQKSDTPLAWDVFCIYQTNPVSQDDIDKDKQPNPLLRPAKVRWGSARYQKPIIKDADGQAIVNSAGDYFDPPPEIDTSRWTATIMKNVAAVPAWLLDYQDCLNDSSITVGGLVVPRGAAKLMQIEISEQQVENDINFYVLTFTLEFLPVQERGVSNWKLSLLNQGYRQLVAGEQRDIMVPDPDDEAIKRRATSPVLLDLDGTVLQNPSPSTAVFLDFFPYPEKDFTVLPLT